MKFYLTFVFIVTFCQKETFSRGYDSKELQKAFVDIVKTLALRNHLLSVVECLAPGDVSLIAFYANAAGIPHIVTKLKNEEEVLRLNSSAIV